MPFIKRNLGKTEEGSILLCKEIHFLIGFRPENVNGIRASLYCTFFPKLTSSPPAPLQGGEGSQLPPLHLWRGAGGEDDYPVIHSSNRLPG